MELEFEICKAHEMAAGAARCKTFSTEGGVIGRASDCDWIIDHPEVSNHHAQISFRDGEFYLTDLSTNGSCAVDDKVLLAKGRPHRIRQGAGYCLAKVEIRARLSGVLPLAGHEPGRPQPAGNLQPLAERAQLDPLMVLAQQPKSMAAELSALISVAPSSHTADCAPIQREHMIVPVLVPAVKPDPLPSVIHAPVEEFWQRLGKVLGVDMQALSEADREALALNAAGLLKQCVAGLQQSLRTRNELKSELRLPVTAALSSSTNPLERFEDAGEALAALIQTPQTRHSPAAVVLAQGFRELQAHQVAMLAASRAALQGALEQLGPQRLRFEFERKRHRSLFDTDGSRWRDYQRHHQALIQDQEWSERLLARDFAQTYQEQVRLIATLHAEYPG